jgi:hypothetical protein
MAEPINDLRSPETLRRVQQFRFSLGLFERNFWTNDDRVKDRLGSWQDSETHKSIYQDRETDALRAQTAPYA